ncbi:MAG TPA: two-component system response regulator [Betaproteobacteria bacterium]|nr:two-component system response regulator [Betaproteobacteria bacterium]
MAENLKVVLLVEDNPDDAELARFALEENHLLNKVVWAQDGRAALDYLFSRNEDSTDALPEMVLLDLKLPKVDGLEVLRQIRAHDATCRLPVVIMTSSKEEQDLIDGYSLGANSYIRKPVDFDQFASAVRQLGLYWLVLNESALPCNRPL